MVELKWIQMFLFLMLTPPFTVVTRAETLSFIVRDGDEVTLPCENVIDGQQNCSYTTWIFSDGRGSSTVELINLGQIGEGGKSKSDRLSVTANCSLVIKKVTVEDVGHYTCRQFRSGQEYNDSQVHLSVINMNEQKDDNWVILRCSVSSYDQCEHKVKWLYEGKDVDKDNKDLQTSQTGCYTTASFLTSHHIYTSRLNLFTCEVTDGHTGKVQLFPFRLQSSGEHAASTTTPTKVRKNENRDKRTNSATPPRSQTPAQSGCCWWFYLIGAIGFVALIVVIMIIVIRGKRSKGNKTQMNENTRLGSNPAVAESPPESGRDAADPEDGVSYASISYIKKSNSKAKVKSGDDEDEGDTVTYSTVKAFSSSSSAAGASADPHDLYATVTNQIR